MARAEEELDMLSRLAELSTRLAGSPTALLDALEHLVAQTPHDADPVRSLTSGEEELLREAGSLQHEMPSFADRASTRTEVEGIRMLKTALPVKEAAERLGVSEGRIRQRLGARTLLGIERSGTWRLPDFQFAEGAEVPGLDVVLPSFPADTHPLAIQLFLQRMHSDLEIGDEAVSPMTWLRSGGSAAAVASLVSAAYQLS